MEESKEISLSEAITHLLEECRTVLPGIQALFGFQLIAVFNTVFSESLDRVEKLLHLTAIGFVAIAIALVMTPAAYHRHISPRAITERFLGVASRLLLWAMISLLLAICMDFYIIAQMILVNAARSLVLSCILLVVFVILWFLLPRREARRLGR